MLLQLKQLQTAAGVVESGTCRNPLQEDEREFDEIEAEPDNAAAGAPAAATQAPNVERQDFAMPSNGNVSQQHADLEVQFRVKQAKLHLDRIRELIAERSFYFSHLTRQVQKNIRTRSQKRVKLLKNKLVGHARMYSCCRKRLEALICEPSLLRRFRPLTRNDIRSSTAVLDPNKPGSSTLQLSWIWHTARYVLMADDAIHDGESDPAIMLECTWSVTSDFV